MLSTLSLSSHILHPLHVSPNESPLRINSRKRYSTLRVYIFFVRACLTVGNFAKIDIHLYICHLLTGGKTSDRKIRRGWRCAGNHASGHASSAPQGRVHHSRCLHTGHNNDLLHYMDLVFRPSGQTKGKGVFFNRTMAATISNELAIPPSWASASGFVKCFQYLGILG